MMAAVGETGQSGHAAVAAELADQRDRRRVATRMLQAIVERVPAREVAHGHRAVWELGWEHEAGEWAEAVGGVRAEAGRVGERERGERWGAGADRVAHDREDHVGLAIRPDSVVA